MPRDSTATLPRWARISKKQQIKDETALSMEQEECYLRTRMHNAMTRRVDEALQAALETHVSPVVKDILAFFEIASPSCDEDSVEERPGKRPRSAEEDPLLAMFEMEPSQRYPMTMLPLATLYGPSSFLDRQETINFMVRNMKQEKKQRPAVCCLRSSGNSSIRFCGTFLQEILRQVLKFYLVVFISFLVLLSSHSLSICQCIAQEPNPQQFQRLFDRTKLSNSSFSQALVVWAQYTVSFDSIIIFIDVRDFILSV